MARYVFTRDELLAVRSSGYTQIAALLHTTRYKAKDGTEKTYEYYRVRTIFGLMQDNGRWTRDRGKVLSGRNIDWTKTIKKERVKDVVQANS